VVAPSSSDSLFVLVSLLEVEFEYSFEVLAVASWDFEVGADTSWDFEVGAGTSCDFEVGEDTSWDLVVSPGDTTSDSEGDGAGDSGRGR